MYRKTFPKCEIDGPLDPVKWSHMESTECIPQKCFECDMLFEGECLRATEQTESYLSLDYGPCKIEGDCEPTIIEDKLIKSKVFVPQKCVHCCFLKYHENFGFTCHEDESTWGEYGKTLDWGSWHPELPNVGLSSGRLVSLELIEAVQNKNLVEAIKEFRKINTGTTIKDGRKAYADLSSKLKKYC